MTKPGNTTRSETGMSEDVVKQAIAQDQRRMSHHRGKSIRRPAPVARGMDS